jgi:3-methyladenine DNA glycosylase AlkD
MSKTSRAKVSVPRQVADEVRAFCIANANPELVKKYAKFFREGYDAFGLDYKNPQWAERRKEWVERLRAAGPEAYLDAGDLLVASGKYEEASFAFELATDLRDTYTPQAFQRIARWFDGGIRNWAHTDVFSGSVLADFVDDGVVPLEAFAEWRTAADKFKRRAVPVTCVTLLKRGTDRKTLLEIVEPLMQDPAREVHQGVGWFLRELWVVDPKRAERVLLRYKDAAPRLIYQYATEKMTAEQKTRFRKTK